jgi:hypothetical protein
MLRDNEERTGISNTIIQFEGVDLRSNTHTVLLE